MSKKIIPQFEFAACAEIFNLSGEIQKAPEPKPQPREDSTAEMFVNHAAIELGRAIIAGEMMLEC